MAFTYSTPANIDDLAGRPTRTAFLDDWHESIADDFNAEISRLPAGNKLFFSETTTPATSQDLPITWNGFPLSIARENPNDPVARWTAADRIVSVDRSTNTTPILMPCRVQDEYCEWFVYRSAPNGPITRVVFTAEAPEYWIMLAKHDFERVVELYQELVSPNVQADDLKLTQDIVFGDDVLRTGTYNPYNKWNTSEGVVHLTHPANTLGAEINLAARATIPRKGIDGNRVTEVRRFACGSNFGDPNRSSDPNIGHGVNFTAIPAAGGATQSITLANPVALYMDQLAGGAITDENGNPQPGWFTFVRGVQGRGLMAVLQPPVGSPMDMDGIRIGNRKLSRGGQVAERLQMVLYGKTASLGHPTPPLRSCINHCCRPNDNVDVSKVNLTHEGPAQTCAKDAFPELTGNGAPLSGLAPGAVLETAVTAEPVLGLSRLAKPSRVD